jgi:hypothetical protein
MTKDQIISAKILAAISGGMTVDAAIDFVLGSGTYAKIASDLYDLFAAKAA